MNAKRLTTTTLAALTTLLSLPAALAHADARRAGLADSALIEDRDDLYFFPQRLTEHPNVIELSYGGTAASGNGLLTLGTGGSVLALAVHRGDAQLPHASSSLAALRAPVSLFGPPFTVAPATIVDLLYGVRLSGAELGLRLSLGHGRQSTTTGGLDTGESDTFVMGEVGYGWGERGRNTRVDLSAAITLDLASANVADTDTDKGTFFGFSALARAFIPLDQALDLGVLGAAGIAHNGLSNEQNMVGPPDRSQLGFNLGGGIGPALSLGKVSLAAYALVNLRVDSQDPNTDASDDETSTRTFVLPGVHMALEVPLTDWLFVRTGAQYTFNWRGTSAPADSGSAQHDATFGWNAGLGVVIDQLRFDGSLQQGFVTGGPDFIGGTGAGFLALATLSYSFDNLRRQPAPAAPPRFEPSVPPAQPPAAAPDVPPEEASPSLPD